MSEAQTSEQLIYSVHLPQCPACERACEGAMREIATGALHTPLLSIRHEYHGRILYEHVNETCCTSGSQLRWTRRRLQRRQARLPRHRQARLPRHRARATPQLT